MTPHAEPVRAGRQPDICPHAKFREWQSRVLEFTSGPVRARCQKCIAWPIMPSSRRFVSARTVTDRRGGDAAAKMGRANDTRSPQPDLRRGGSVRDNCPSLSGDARATARTSHDALAATRLASIARWLQVIPNSLMMEDRR